MCEGDWLSMHGSHKLMCSWVGLVFLTTLKWIIVFKMRNTEGIFKLFWCILKNCAFWGKQHCLIFFVFLYGQKMKQKHTEKLQLWSLLNNMGCLYIFRIVKKRCNEWVLLSKATSTFNYFLSFSLLLWVFNCATTVSKPKIEYNFLSWQIPSLLTWR